MSTGVIYVAVGPEHLELAASSARSLKSSNPGLPVEVFTDQADAPAIFDRVRSVPLVHSRAKLECMRLTPFERTLYLDCDTLVTAPMGDLFDVLDRFDLAVAHDVRRLSDLVRQGYRSRTPYAFPQMNSGVMLYRRSEAMMEFLTEWARRYHEAGLVRDQATLKDLLWESDLRFYVLPPEFNLRRVTLLDGWEPLDAQPTIVHSHRLKDHLGGDRSRIETLPDLIEAERTARAREWRDVGVDVGKTNAPGGLLSGIGAVPAKAAE